MNCCNVSIQSCHCSANKFTVLAFDRSTLEWVIFWLILFMNFAPICPFFTNSGMSSFIPDCCWSRKCIFIRICLTGSSIWFMKGLCSLFQFIVIRLILFMSFAPICPFFTNSGMPFFIPDCSWSRKSIFLRICLTGSIWFMKWLCSKVIIIQVGSIRKCTPALSSEFANKQYLR